jgi:hypothetical protein
LIYLRREVAKRASLTQRAFPDHARISFAKVAEYQKRGAVHFHAVIRLDGPEGGDTPPPAWATTELLTDAIRAAATLTRIDGPVIDGRAHTFSFGRQLDVRPIRSADFDSGQELTERAVAAYIAKYATKGAETATGTLDRPIRFLAELAHARITGHARRLIRTAWTSARAKSWQTSACAPGPTCSASAVTSPPNPAATPPPSEPSETPAPNGARSGSSTRPAGQRHHPRPRPLGVRRNRPH